MTFEDLKNKESVKIFVGLINKSVNFKIEEIIDSTNNEPIYKLFCNYNGLKLFLYIKNQEDLNKWLKN